MACGPGVYYVAAWRFGANTVLVSLSATTLLLFLYVQSLHNYGVSSNHDQYAGFSKPALIYHDGLLPCAGLPGTAEAFFGTISFIAISRLPVLLFRLSVSPSQLNSRAPPAFWWSVR